MKGQACGPEERKKVRAERGLREALRNQTKKEKLEGMVNSQEQVRAQEQMQPQEPHHSPQGSQECPDEKSLKLGPLASRGEEKPERAEVNLDSAPSLPLPGAQETRKQRRRRMHKESGTNSVAQGTGRGELCKEVLGQLLKPQEDKQVTQCRARLSQATEDCKCPGPACQPQQKKKSGPSGQASSPVPLGKQVEGLGGGRPPSRSQGLGKGWGSVQPPEPTTNL